MNSYKRSKSKEYGENLRSILPGGVHHNFNYQDKRIQTVFTKGRGSRLWDIDGNEYLDLYAKFGSMILGHNNPEYNQALIDCINRVTAADYTEICGDVCRILCHYIPCCEMVRFGLSGTEMVQNALRLARAYTKKNKVLRFEGHFHGTGDAIMGGKVSDIGKPIPKDDGEGVFSTEGRAKGVLEGQTLLLPWNDLRLLEETVCEYADELGAVLLEPIAINGGSIMPKEGFLEGVQDLCRRHHCILIFDEMVTGIRMGLGGAQSVFQVIPDLSIWGKCVSNGTLPVSLIAGRRDIMKLYEEPRVVHGGTFNGYPLGLAAVKATFDVISNNESELYQNITQHITKIHSTFLEEAEKIGLDLVIQGPATCASFHCRRSALEKYDELNNEIILKNEILRNCLASYGILMSSISRIYPNFSICEADVIFFKERVSHALNDARLLIKRLVR